MNFSWLARRIHADAKDVRVSAEFAPGIAQAARLDGASRRIILRIEIENDGRTAEIRERDLLPGPILSADRLSAELRRQITHF